MSLRSAASMPSVSAGFGTAFSSAAYLVLGIDPSKGVSAWVTGLARHGMGLPRGVLRQDALFCPGRGIRGRDGPRERRRIDVQGVVARREVPAPVVDERGLDLLADLGRVPAARVEA